MTLACFSKYGRARSMARSTVSVKAKRPPGFLAAVGYVKMM
jgi:hypothetical protein